MEAISLETFRALLDWRVILDIITIGLIIFFLYHTLRTTGTWKIALGILIAAVLFFIARLLDLKGTEWIYSNLSQVLLLGLIIIFQPEIRKIFERAASIRPREAIKEGSKIAHLTSEVVFTLAQKKRGALIVFSGKDSLEASTSAGIVADAKPSFPLFMSIFDPHSPGHDGATIIENGLMRAFGVRLPLSKMEKLSEEFGTRHHAAMGLSETTDAMVIAVSEERQTVTLFVDGAFQSVQDKNILIAKIVEHLETIGSYEVPGFTTKKRKTLIIELAISLLVAFIFRTSVIFF